MISREALLGSMDDRFLSEYFGLNNTKYFKWLLKQFLYLLLSGSYYT